MQDERLKDFPIWYVAHVACGVCTIRTNNYYSMIKEDALFKAVNAWNRIAKR